MFKELLELALSAVYLWVYGDMKSTSWCYLWFFSLMQKCANIQRPTLFGHVTWTNNG